MRGWTSLIATVLLLGSAQLLVLGMIGEYLGRLYMQSKNRPLFVIDEIRGRARWPRSGEVIEAPAGGATAGPPTDRQSL